MIRHLTVLLLFQLAGEAISRGAGLPLPGPVLGMALLFATMLAVPRLSAIATTAQGLLAHLSLLFVPAGVGVVGQLDRLGADGPGLALAIVGSTAIAIVAGVYTFLAVAKAMGR